MEIIDINLTESEFAQLNDIYPPTVKSSSVGDRAEELVKYYFRKTYKDCKFTYQTDGSDLLVEWNTGSVKIEIKGTADSTIAWSKLKVSSQTSHDLLKNGLPLYRVVSVYDRQPQIYILVHGVDFTMYQEARWAVRSA